MAHIVNLYVQTLEQCVAKDAINCSYSYVTQPQGMAWVLVPFFCGHSKTCL